MHANSLIQEAVNDFEPVFIAKQPIFDREGGLWGYELLFRQDGLDHLVTIDDQEKATARVIVDGVALVNVEEGCKLLVNFPRDLIVRGAPLALPRHCFVVEILEHVPADAEVLAALRDLRERGYTLAVDDFTGQPELEPFFDLADIVKVDFLGMSAQEALKQTLSLQKRWSGLGLLAEKIEDQRSYQLAWVLGYSLFQGFFFRRPETLSGRKISIGAMAKFRLLREISREDYEVATLGRIISSDSSLSYRLLRYVNSVAFSLRVKVSSLKQAVTLLGSQSLKHWLMAVVIADVAPTPHAQEVAYICVQRGRFMELCAAIYQSTPRDQDTMFLFGLFSELDTLLGQTMGQLMEKMPLDSGVKAALQGEKNDLYSWLELCEAIEQAKWGEMDSLMEQLSLPQQKTARMHGSATAWASDIMGLCMHMQSSNQSQEKQA